jgi:hypothetical protein
VQGCRRGCRRLEGGGRLVVFERSFEAEPHQCESLDTTTAGGQDRRLRRECLSEDLGQRECLCDVQGGLDALRRKIVLSGEEHEAPELGGECREVVVGLFQRQDLERAIHDLEPFFEAPAIPHHLGQPC